jgi:two-component system osmolarity sensor histidine kinase EnvZ
VQQLAQLTTSAVNLTRAALLAADPAKRRDLLVELSEREGIRLHPAEPEDKVTDLPDQPFYRLLRSETIKHLGNDTRLALTVNGEEGLWASFYLEDADDPDDQYWVMLPSERASRDFPWHWLGWGGASLALALLVAWWIVSRVTRPLRALSHAAAEVGRGRQPEPVAEAGADELKQLARSFNQMSEDLARNDAERAEILAGISHDLRTPLARLRLEAEMSVNDETAREAIAADIDQMDAIIAQFLDYARGDGGEGREDPHAAECLNGVLHGRRVHVLDEDDLGGLPALRTGDSREHHAFRGCPAHRLRRCPESRFRRVVGAHRRRQARARPRRAAGHRGERRDG